MHDTATGTKTRCVSQVSIVDPTLEAPLTAQRSTEYGNTDVNRYSVMFKRAGGFSDYSRDAFFTVIIGTKRNHRRLLPGLRFRLPEFKEQ